MDPEMLQTSRLKSGEAVNNLHKQSCQDHCQNNLYCLNGAHETLVPEGMNNVLCSEENCREHQPSGTPNRAIAEGFIGAMQSDIVPENLRQKKEMTLQDMYNQKEDYDDDDDDFDWNPLAKCVDFEEVDYDDDEDDDWQPLAKRVDKKNWFCTNCTMMNIDDVFHCDVCGEYKDSEIVRHGFFASHTAQEASHAQVKSELVGRYEDSCEQKLALENCTAVGFDERMLLHSEVEMKSHPHPERPDRLRAITASLATAGIFPGRCIPIPAREITQEELKMVHSLEHIEAVELTSCMLSSYFTPDTYANEHSACAARLAAGLCADLSSTIMSGRAKNGFALVRPPGHHAGVKQAMGFCLHNNAAVAALAAQGANAKKVLIVDWDVHHGNGTQEIFDGNKSVLYISLHRHDGGRFYPGTGAADEVGVMDAKGYCVNVPWKRGGVGDNDYMFAFQHVVLPIASEFAPDLTIISAGFDAARGDPLGCCDVTPAGFAQMTHMLKALSSGKLLVILEGGYNLRSISSSATAVIKVLLGESPGYELEGIMPSKTGMQTVLEVLKIQMKFWPNLESIFTRLQSQWASFAIQNMKKRTKKRRQVFVPTWWKWGRKRLIYNLLSAQLQLKVKGRAKRLS